MPPKVDQAAHEAALRARMAARQAAEYSRRGSSRPGRRPALSVRRPRPVARRRWRRCAARSRPKEIEKLARKHQRRARAGRLAKGLAVLGVLAGGAFAAWKWWDKQANPDWLVEPPAATEVPDPGQLAPVDGSGQDALDPEVQAKQAEAEAAERDERG